MHSAGRSVGWMQPWFQRLGLALGSIAVTSASLGWGSPALAGDPFRSNNPMPIGDKTEAAFEAMFKAGDYKTAVGLLEQAKTAEPNEPLVYPMLALVAQYEQDNAALPGLATETRRAAKAIQASQPLRSNLYLAVAEFIDGAYILSDQGDGPVRGLGKALGRLRSFNAAMKAARQIDPNDPELNLLQGFTDMYASAYLPLSSTDEAVEKLQQASPAYLSHWLTGLGYRILGKTDQGLAAIDQGLALQGSHPEMHYLKAQLAHRKGQDQKDKGQLAIAQTHFDRALAAPEVLPLRLVTQILQESCQNQEALDGKDRACDRGSVKNAVNSRAGNSRWGAIKPAEVLQALIR